MKKLYRSLVKANDYIAVRCFPLLLKQGQFSVEDNLLLCKFGPIPLKMNYIVPSPPNGTVQQDDSKEEF